MKHYIFGEISIGNKEEFNVETTKDNIALSGQMSGDLNPMHVDKDYEIRFARENDIPQIMKFIDDYWKKGHILSYDRTLFEWQYQRNNKVNMVLGLKENKLLGVLGFVVYDSSDTKDVVLALWKAVPGESFLGIKLLIYLIKNEPHRLIMCPGINMKTTGGIYKRMGMYTGKMTQWYRLSPVDKYSIAKVVNGNIPKVRSNNDRFVELKSFSQFKQKFDFNSDAYKESIPFKSLGYIEGRYFYHPTYTYHKFGIESEGKIETVVVIRLQECNGTCAVRIVDVIGNAKIFPQFTPFFDDYMKKVKAEYMDIYEVGISDTDLIDSGWMKVEESGNIIPNYFAPYLSENIDINYSTSDNKAVMFRGDGDQDRPN